METQVDTVRPYSEILMPRSFHSCLLTKLNSRLALQAVIQRDRSISNCISPTTSSAFPLLVFFISHLALVLLSLGEVEGMCQGPLPFHALVFVQTTGKWKLSVRKGFDCLRSAER
ncbi:hypothetical protein INR49_003373 [Caranx melampygus]|nr:hypothetical protein INR49_003373 [Caranx melampygus]